MKEIILATYNEHKRKELSAIFGDRIILKSLRDINFNTEIIEDGVTFIENSLIKCKAVYERTKLPVLADDSGLCVDALDGRPGIYSARYGGEGLTDVDRYEKLLEEIPEGADRSAAFVCALVLFINPNRIYVIQEEVTGEITFEPRGENGFGYDPVFYLPQFKKTAAELTNEEKNEISHRGKAAKVMETLLHQFF